MDKQIGTDIGGNEMKIYHTETQADYDALMVELEKQGVKRPLATNPTDANHWPEFESQTGIKVRDRILTYHGVEYFEREYPETPIIKYTAKKETQLPEWANWLARNVDETLVAYRFEPIKVKEIDGWGIKFNPETSLSFKELLSQPIKETDDTFSHIKWTDEEPTSVKSLIKEFSDQAESLRELGEALTRNWEAEHSKPSVAEYNQWQITQAKAHGYDELPELSNPDIINEPSHYKGRHGLEAIEVVRNFGNDDMVAGFYWGNAIKYMTRYRNKNGLEDLKKARKNLDWLIEHMEAIE